MNEVNFEEDAAPEVVQAPLSTTAGPMGQVLSLVAQATALQARIEKGQALLDDLNDQLRTIEDFKLPEAMDAANVKKLQLQDGGELSVKNVIKASLNAENQERGFAWLRSNDHGDLIKREIKAEFGRGQDEEAQKMISIIREAGYDPVDKSSVHWQTLNAFVKEQLEAGKNIPEDIFSVYKGRKASIKKPKEKGKQSK